MALVSAPAIFMNLLIILGLRTQPCSSLRSIGREFSVKAEQDLTLISNSPATRNVINQQPRPGECEMPVDMKKELCCGVWCQTMGEMEDGSIVLLEAEMRDKSDRRCHGCDGMTK